MPGVDLLDAFAELVVCVVFNLPRDDKVAATHHSSDDRDNDDDDEGPAGANSSGTTQIFSRVNSMEESQSQANPLQLSPNTREVAAFTALNITAAPMTCAAPSPLSGASSTQSLDLYPGGIWNPAARLSSPHPASGGSSGAAVMNGANPSSSGSPCVSNYNNSSGNHALNNNNNNNNNNLNANSTGVPVPAPQPPSSSHPSSVASLNTGDISTPRSGGPSAGFWNRLLNGSGVLHTPPRSSSYGQFPNTGVTTNASSYVQLTEEELGMMSTSGRANNNNNNYNFNYNSNNNNNNSNTAGASYMSGNGGAMSGWTGYSTPQQLEWAGGDSRGVPTPSNLSTPLYEASPCASSTQPPATQVTTPTAASPQQQQQQQQQPSLRLNPHGLYIAARRSNSPQEGQSQASSSSEFVVL